MTIKSTVISAILAVVLAVAGWGFWTLGHTEQRLAEAHKQLAVLQYAEAGSESDDAASTFGALKNHRWPWACGAKDHTRPAAPAGTGTVTTSSPAVTSASTLRSGPSTLCGPPLQKYCTRVVPFGT